MGGVTQLENKVLNTFVAGKMTFGSWYKKKYNEKDEKILREYFFTTTTTTTSTEVRKWKYGNNKEVGWLSTTVLL